MGSLSSIAFDEAATPWGTSRRAALWHFCLPPAVYVALFSIRWVDKDLLRDLAREDSLFEWTQAACFLVATIASAVVARRFHVQRRAWLAAAYGVLCLGLFFVLGEELAWGQRIFGFAPPPTIAEANTKAELSLHNMLWLNEAFNWPKPIAGAFVTLGVAFLLSHRARGKRTTLDCILVPAFASSPFLIVLVTGVLRLTLLRDRLPVGYNELQEMFLAYGMALYLVLMVRRTNPKTGEGLPPAGAG